MQSPSVDSPQNKELLWDTLQESGAFAGLKQSQFQPVQSAFDRTVSAAARFSSSMSLNDANKRIIREFVQVLQQLRQPGQPALAQQPSQQPAQQPAHLAQPIELVYRAEDLQNERASEFDRNLREKQAEMDSFLTLKKPNDVSFKDKDKGVPDDKPIGDEMARLIAQELAVRERELVQLKPEDIKRAQQWIGTTDNNPIKIELPPSNNFAKKSVSFSEEYDMDENFEEMDTDMDIFSKFKKISETATDAEMKTSTSTTDTPITMQQIYTKLLELEQRMDANHAEIMEHLNSKGGVIGERFP
jgi:hypothetical protein